MKITAKDIVNCTLHKSQVGVWYLGQEGFLFKNKNTYLAIDPYLSDYVDKNCSELVKWKRLYAPPIQAEELSFLNVVLCTHLHYDHTDPETLLKLANSNPYTRFVVPAPAVKTVAGYGIGKERIISAFANQPLILDGFEIFPLPSAHETFHMDENGNYCELGYVVKMNGKTIFHAGDMCMYDGLIERLTNIDVGLLPINGRDYFRNKLDIIGNFNCEEAVLLAKNAGIKTIIPMHHDLYAVNCESPERFIEQIRKYNILQKYTFLKVKDCFMI